MCGDSGRRRQGRKASTCAGLAFTLSQQRASSAHQTGATSMPWPVRRKGTKDRGVALLRFPFHQGGYGTEQQEAIRASVLLTSTEPCDVGLEAVWRTAGRDTPHKQRL